MSSHKDSGTPQGRFEAMFESLNYAVPEEVEAKTPEEIAVAQRAIAFVLQRMSADLIPTINEIIVTEVNKAIAATRNIERKHYEPMLVGRQIPFLGGVKRWPSKSQ